jgi:hypothetical protein
MKKIMFLLLWCAVLTTFSALANAQGFHETIIRPEAPMKVQPAIQNLQPAIQNLQPAIQNLQPAIQSESVIPQQSAISHQSEQSTISEQSATSRSVTIQATPTPDDSYHPEGHHHHHPEDTPTPAPPMAFGAGERYPQTRTGPITEEDAVAMSYAELRYAINEVYARHGADFPTQRAIAKRFRQFEWYHPKEGVPMSEIENEFSETERANVKVLARYREQKWASGER